MATPCMGKWTVTPNMVMRQVTISVRFKGIRVWRVKMWLAVQLIHLAVWLTGAGFEFEGLED